MEAKPILWEVPRSKSRPFRCFVSGCENEAGHLSKFTHGAAVVQVCLCDDCVNEQPESIINGFKW